MVTTLDVSPKSKTISDYLENVQRGEYLILDYMAGAEDVIS